MNRYEVPEPILNSPYEEPAAYWLIREGEPPQRLSGRRPAMYYYRPPTKTGETEPDDDAGTAIELKLVNRIRERMQSWREQSWPGVTRTTLELLRYWRREGREHRLFFAQLEAAETIIFLLEARPDFLQGIPVPLDEPSPERQAAGFRAFGRYGCKMATGAGKTTVIGMLAAWSILNKVHFRGDARFSDVALAVCPNVTIRNRLQELKPELGEASLYRKRDLVPPHLVPDLARGRVLVTNWHVFEPQAVQVGGTSARVNKSGARMRIKETITIGPKAAASRGRRQLALEEFERQVAAGLLEILSEERDRQGNLKKVEVASEKYVESDTALVNRVLGREVGGKQNILVFNDEAHHAYRIPVERPEDWEQMDEDEREEWLAERQEATVWIEGLDRIHKLRTINLCVDLSATPYYLGHMGEQTNRIFPWVVSDFGLTDAIESGLVKIPQLAVRDTTGATIPGYFNIWRWILPQLTASERGGAKGSPKPEAVLKWANTPISMLAGLWEDLRRQWEQTRDDPRPPVFIIVCKSTKIASVVYKWLAENNPPAGIPPCQIEALRNTNGRINTVRVDSRVIQETDTGQAKSDESKWMRFTLDSVGKMEWPRDSQGRPLYPPEFEELARRLKRPLHPPGRDVRAIVSVGMLTEGWDCTTVTHIIGLRPFLSQLLCEQVVGRGLRRTVYDVGAEGRLIEETAKVFGVPFQVIPFKETKGPAPPPPKRHHVHAVPEKAEFEIVFPRVEGYRQAIRNRITADWGTLATLMLDPLRIPPEVDMKAGLTTNQGRPALTGPGKLERVDMNPYRRGRRLQELVFELARDITRHYAGQEGCEAPAHVLFPQITRIAQQYLEVKVHPVPPADLLDVFCSPYYGWVIERLVEAIRPASTGSEAPELPCYETNRGPGSTAEVDFWTSRDVREVAKSHLNYIVADTAVWEQSAANLIDGHDRVAAFVKNTGLGFAIPYLHNGQMHDYQPDFIIRLKDELARYLILETKGYDPLAEIKAQAAQRWVAAVNHDGQYGHWEYAVARVPGEVISRLNEAFP